MYNVFVHWKFQQDGVRFGGLNTIIQSVPSRCEILCFLSSRKFRQVPVALSHSPLLGRGLAILLFLCSYCQRVPQPPGCSIPREEYPTESTPQPRKLKDQANEASFAPDRCADDGYPNRSSRLVGGAGNRREGG
jgi:hypothetical protein